MKFSIPRNKARCKEPRSALAWRDAFMGGVESLCTVGAGFACCTHFQLCEGSGPVGDRRSAVELSQEVTRCLRLRSSKSNIIKEARSASYFLRIGMQFAK